MNTQERHIHVVFAKNGLSYEMQNDGTLGENTDYGEVVRCRKHL